MNSRCTKNDIITITIKEITAVTPLNKYQYTNCRHVPRGKRYRLVLHGSQTESLPLSRNEVGSPAYAGIRICSRAGTTSCGDHPHVRGAYANGLWSAYRRGGSSPRAWGLWRDRGCAGRTRRFIPTCVGLMLILKSSRHSRTVHPHVRGAYADFLWAEPIRYGSSPRAWGLCPCQLGL